MQNAASKNRSGAHEPAVCHKPPYGLLPALPQFPDPIHAQIWITPPGPDAPSASLYLAVEIPWDAELMAYQLDAPTDYGLLSISLASEKQNLEWGISLSCDDFAGSWIDAAENKVKTKIRESVCIGPMQIPNPGPGQRVVVSFQPNA
jgi:hypothetical protein